MKYLSITIIYWILLLFIIKLSFFFRLSHWLYFIGTSYYKLSKFEYILDLHYCFIFTQFASSIHLFDLFVYFFIFFSFVQVVGCCLKLLKRRHEIQMEIDKSGNISQRYFNVLFILMEAEIFFTFFLLND